MVVRRQTPLVRQLFYEGQMRDRDIMGIIKDQALDSILDQQPHETALAISPMAFEGQPQSPVQIIAQCLLVFIVFGASHRQNRVPSASERAGRRTRCVDEINDRRRLPTAWISDDDMPGTILPGGTQQRLKTFG